MKKIDLKTKSALELQKLIKESELRLREIAFSTSGAGEKSFVEKRNLKKTIARSKTQLASLDK
ncbi:MAG: hypothetical protein KA007_02890 [Candidatus Pacebacteria bacterium]|jgi:ribosomal protein L29|nr:hypothetical protein [Candidatus Paceibacterota bacterium]